MVKKQQQRPAKHKNDGTEQQQDTLGCHRTKSPMALDRHKWVLLGLFMLLGVKVSYLKALNVKGH